MGPSKSGEATVDNKQVYPRIPEKNWWILRDQFKKSIPSQVTVTYLKSLLAISDKAASNLLPPLRQVGLIDEEGKPTSRANDWRADATYPQACEDMLEAIYPQELRDLYSGKGLDKLSAQNWFLSTARQGEGTAKLTAQFYALLNDATPHSSDEFKKSAAKPKKAASKPTESPTAKAPSPTVAAPAESPIPSSQSIPVSASDTKSSQMSFHIDLQIHISPEASADQIEQIFVSIARHLPFPKNG